MTTAADNHRGQGIAAYTLGNYPMALELLRQPAISGDAEAQWRMGVMAADGYGMPVNYEEAMHWFLAAVASGKPRSYYDVGLMYELGEGRDKDFELARQWYMRGVILNCIECMAELGQMYWFGNEIAEDHTKAIPLLTDAAAHGNPQALVLIGRIEIGSRGAAAQNHALALFQQAADQGYDPGGLS